jgi:hypothetical protein
MFYIGGLSPDCFNKYLNKAMKEWTQFINPASIATILCFDAQVILIKYTDKSQIFVR